ncbi:MAG: NAD(P)(+) transhydrogenase (Re/Si-specific) subunit alpha, partial [Opitutales bacterium]|nr:NAD(P)(+) transhydrogenase (Re/Si-specific) subunit alpha [Opitutales bacterium]
MKTLFVPSESFKNELRAAITPADAAKLAKLGWSVYVQSGAGLGAGFTDADYSNAGANIASADFEKQADFVVCVRKPSLDSIKNRKRGSFHLSLLDPFNEKELIKAFAEAGVSAASFEMIPRSTIAQKMDVLSSQSNLAGYYSVLKAATTINKIMP